MRVREKAAIRNNFSEGRARFGEQGVAFTRKPPSVTADANQPGISSTRIARREGKTGKGRRNKSATSDRGDACAPEGKSVRDFFSYFPSLSVALSLSFPEERERESEISREAIRYAIAFLTNGSAGNSRRPHTVVEHSRVTPTRSRQDGDYDSVSGATTRSTTLHSAYLHCRGITSESFARTRARFASKRALDFARNPAVNPRATGDFFPLFFGR